MAKAKVITALALTTVMFVVMTGLAAADPAEIDIKPDGIINLVPGSYVETTAHLSEMVCDGSSRTLHVYVVEGTKEDLTFKVTDITGTGSAGPTSGGINYTYTPANGTTTYDIKVEIMAAAGTEGKNYTLYYEDIQSGKWDKASASVPASAIPEFATIAIPAVAVLGLFLFYNHRKRKEE